MKPESRPSSEQGLAKCRQSGGAFDHEFTQTPLAKHASFSGSLVAEVYSLCISSVCLITLDFPQTERQRAASCHLAVLRASSDDNDGPRIMRSTSWARLTSVFDRPGIASIFNFNFGSTPRDPTR